jgi:hypothetical protein
MKITLRQANTKGGENFEIQVQHGDYQAIKGKLFIDILTLPHCTYGCYWCGCVNNRFTLRTDWRTFNQMEVDRMLGLK